MTPVRYTAQKLKFSIKDLFSKCDQICSFLRIWSHLLKKSLMENFILLYSDMRTRISSEEKKNRFLKSEAQADPRKRLRCRALLKAVDSSVIRQNGESQNGCFNKTKHAKFSEKRTFLTPMIRTRACLCQVVRNDRCSENLACFVFLKRPF